MPARRPPASSTPRGGRRTGAGPPSSRHGNRLPVEAVRGGCPWRLPAEAVCGVRQDRTMAPVRHVTDEERRARIARRHGIAPGERYADPVAATEAMTVLHATEPASVYLSLLARVDGLTVEDVDRAMYDDRTLVKQLAMRRTVFVFPRDLLPAAWGSASARVAVQLRARLAKEVETHGIAANGAVWLEEACAAVLDLLADGTERGAQVIRETL